MGLIERSEPYLIRVCSECGMRLPRVDHRCPEHPRAAALSIEVVPISQLRGAVEALHRAHAVLDAEQGHTKETWADREQFGPPPRDAWTFLGGQ